MGCAQSRQQSQQPVPLFEQIFSEKEYLDHMIQYIIKEKDFCYVLDRMLFQDIKKQLEELCWPYEDKASLARLIEDYIRFSIEETHKIDQGSKQIIQKKTKYQIKKFGQEFGSQVSTILNSVKNKNKDIIGTLQFYKNFSNWQFPLGVQTQRKKQIIKKTLVQINKIAQNCQQCFFYLSLILVNGCKKLQKARISVLEINRQLQQTIQFINVQTIDTPQTNVLSQTMLLYHQIRDSHYQKYPTKTYTKFPYPIIKLQGDGPQREHQYQQQILKVVDNAKKEFQYFDGFMYSVFKLFKCVRFKINFKLKYREDTQALERIKEKILFKQPNQYKKDEELDYESIQELRASQKLNRVEEMRKILLENQKIELNISDLLRGRCLFPTIQDLVGAADSIVNKIQRKREKGSDVELLEIENRLKTRTNDLVLKIRIRSTVTEFQMTLAPKGQPECFKNSIYHKVYEIARSKTLSSISMLFDWHQKMTKIYIKFLQKVFQHKNTKKTSQDTQIFNSIINNVQLKKIMQRQDKTSSSSSSQKIALKNDIIAILLANKIIDDQKVNEIKDTTVQRTADFYKKIGNSYRQAQILEKGIQNQQIREDHKRQYIRRLTSLKEKKIPVRKTVSL